MIIRQDSCGTWTVTSGQVLQYGAVAELEIVLQDEDGNSIEPAQYGDTWALSLWTPSASDPVELANGYFAVDGGHLVGELDLTSEALYLYCAERARSIVSLTLHSVTDPFEAALELSTRALVQWQGDNHRVGPPPPCPPAPPPTSEDIATRIASAMADHNADSSAHPGIANGFQPLIDQSNPLPALYVSGLDPVATSGSYAQLKNVPERFTPSPHTHSVEDITDLAVGWDDISGKPETFTPSSHTHTKSQITDLSLAWGDITGKPETFAPAAHTHTKSEITDLSLGWNDIIGKPETFTPAAHTHTTADVSQPVTVISSALVSTGLADGGMYSHTPSSSPVYTLPDIAQAEQSKAHEIVVDVKFSASALSVAFETIAGTLVEITPDFDPASGDVYRFLCAWTTLAGWSVKAVPLELA